MLLAFGVRANAQTATIKYYHLDALGSVRAVTNQSGAVIERHDYLPFGEEVSPPAGAQSHQFTGQERDAETGMDYFGARYYSGRRGRFTTVDPVITLEENLVDPQRWNRYAYVRNNPLRYTDPDGRALESAWDLFNIGIGVGSFVSNVKQGNFGAAALDVGGILLDSGAAAVPFLPGGAGAAIRGARAAKTGPELVLDTNAVISHGKDFVRSGQNVVKSVISEIEIATAAAQGKIRGAPRAAGEIPSVGLPGINENKRPRWLTW